MRGFIPGGLYTKSGSAILDSPGGIRWGKGIELEAFGTIDRWSSQSTNGFRMRICRSELHLLPRPEPQKDCSGFRFISWAQRPKGQKTSAQGLKPIGAKISAN